MKTNIKIDNFNIEVTNVKGNPNYRSVTILKDGDLYKGWNASEKATDCEIVEHFIKSEKEVCELTKAIEKENAEKLQTANEEIDLFEHYENLPKEVLAIIDQVAEESELNYIQCNKLVEDLNNVGYTCEYGLDAQPYNLKKL